jgi:hypothetical protein
MLEPSEAEILENLDTVKVFSEGDTMRVTFRFKKNDFFNETEIVKE